MASARRVATIPGMTMSDKIDRTDRGMAGPFESGPISDMPREGHRAGLYRPALRQQGRRHLPLCRLWCLACSTPGINTTPVVAGPAFGNPWPAPRWPASGIWAWAWRGSRSIATAVALTWAMFSRMGPSPRACVTVSTPHRSTSNRLATSADDPPVTRLETRPACGPRPTSSPHLAGGPLGRRAGALAVLAFPPFGLYPGAGGCAGGVSGPAGGPAAG
jgi:hypothetical protein